MPVEARELIVADFLALRIWRKIPLVQFARTLLEILNCTFLPLGLAQCKECSSQGRLEQCRFRVAPANLSSSPGRYIGSGADRKTMRNRLDLGVLVPGSDM